MLVPKQILHFRSAPDIQEPPLIVREYQWCIHDHTLDDLSRQVLYPQGQIEHHPNLLASF